MDLDTIWFSREFNEVPPNVIPGGAEAEGKDTAFVFNITTLIVICIGSESIVFCNSLALKRAAIENKYLIVSERSTIRTIAISSHDQNFFFANWGDQWVSTTNELLVEEVIRNSLPVF